MTMNSSVEMPEMTTNYPKSGSLPWFALQVRTQHERAVSDLLQVKGYEWFLPFYKCRKRWSDRIKEVDAPLFPGYLFCRFDVQERLPILKTPGVIQIVGYNRRPVSIDESEIHAIQTLVSAGIPNQPWPYLHAGDRVQIESGALRGVSGILTDFKGKHRLIVSITLLQRAVAVEIDAALVTPHRGSEEEKTGRAFSHPRPMPAAI